MCTAKHVEAHVSPLTDSPATTRLGLCNSLHLSWAIRLWQYVAAVIGGSLHGRGVGKLWIIISQMTALRPTWIQHFLYTNGLVQDCSISIALSMEIL